MGNKAIIFTVILFALSMFQLHQYNQPRSRVLEIDKELQSYKKDSLLMEADSVKAMADSLLLRIEEMKNRSLMDN